MLSAKKTSAAIAVAAALGTALDAPGAGATVGVPAFSLTPSTTQAGAAPSISIDATLAPTPSDDPQSVTLSLASGLLANPTVPATCSDADLHNNTCPGGSQIGSGTVTATALGVSSGSPANLYLVQPAATGEVGRVGMVVSTAFGTIVTEGPVTVRTKPDVGADISFTNLPQQVGGVSVTVNRIQLTVNGTVGGAAFTRNPTSCSPATTTIQVVSYNAPSSPASAQSAFTPTGCATLPFAPKLSGTAAVSGLDGSTAFTTTIGQAGGEAATRNVTLGLPYGLKPRYDVFARACAASDPSTCPASATVGSATVTTPLLSAPLSGRVVLVSSSGSFPAVAIVFPSPFPITLTGTSGLTNGRFITTLSGIPDLPLSKITTTLDGGSDSLLYGGYALCAGSPTVTGDFSAQSGATSSVTGPVSVNGCPGN